MFQCMSSRWQVWTRPALLAQGTTSWSIRALIDRGELRSMGRGVYLAGPRLGGDDGWYQDVVIAAATCDGVLAGQAAAALHDLDGYDPGAPISLAVSPTRSSRSSARRSDLLRPPVRIGPVDVMAVEEALLGLGAVTTPRPGCAAASHDLAPSELVELAVEAALRKGVVTVEALRSIALEGRRRPGAATLAAVLERRG